MKPSSIFLGCVLMFALALTPFQVQAQSVINEQAYRALLLELIEVLQQQILTLQTELEDRQIVEVEPRPQTKKNKLGDSISLAAKYSIDDAYEVERISNREHREYFTRVFELFPDEYDEKVKKLEVFVGENAVFDAYVETIPPQHEYWRYSVNSEIIEDEGSEATAELIVHELAHMISYQEAIDIPNYVEADCEEYFDIHGCPSEDSYMRQFVDLFWSPSDLKRAEKFAATGDPFDEAYDYYELHEDEYVSDYAASGPEEDFAESFMFYVMGESTPRDTEAREKVEFFKRYSDLVTIRREILNNL